METFIYITIALAIAHLLIRAFLKRNRLPPKTSRQPDRYLAEGDRTIEEILGGRSIDEIFAELNAIKHKDRTGNEILVLWGITQHYEKYSIPYELNES